MFKNLNTKISASIFLLLCVIIVAVSFAVAPFNKIAQALVQSYTKNTGSQLTPAEWQNLPIDFLARNGGNSMGVDLDMASHRIVNLSAPAANTDATTKQYVDNKVSASSIVDTSGTPLKVVCGRTTPADWVTYVGSLNTTVYVDVDMSSAGFNAIPEVVTSIYGNQQHFKTYGATSIYDLTKTSFRIYVYSISLPIDAPTVQAWGWGINWCGYGS